MTNYELLLFDADETLFDFHKAMCESLSKTLAQCGVKCSDKMIETYDEINNEYWHRYENGEITRPQMQKGRFDDFLARFNINYQSEKIDKIYLEKLAGCPYLYDGAKELCEDLSHKYRMAIVTNGISSMQRKRMESSDVAKYFEYLFISGDTGYKKPEKGFFDYVFSFYSDVPHEKFIIIGDSIGSDIKGGSDAGIATCWLNRRGAPCDASVRIDYEVHSLAEIRSLFL